MFGVQRLLPVPPIVAIAPRAAKAARDVRMTSTVKSALALCNISVLHSPSSPIISFCAEETERENDCSMPDPTMPVAVIPSTGQITVVPS